MDRETRNELVKTVESQKEHLQRYENRLRDVVSAYKGVVKEKEALEASLKVLSESNQASKQQYGDGRDDNDGSTDGGEQHEDAAFSDPLNINTGVAKDGKTGDTDIAALRGQIQTLSSSLVTFTEEKSKLEAGFVADKKTRKLENEELHQQLEQEKEKSAAAAKEFQEQIQDLKNKIRSQQLEREKEQTDHVLMLRELQKLMADERMIKEALENQLDEAQSTLKEKEGLVPDMSAQYERRIQSQMRELDTLRNQLKESKEQASQPQPMLLDLQQDMANMKAQGQRQIQQERERANETEETLKTLAMQSEERIAGLEAKLSELSEVVGNYERLRYQDQQAILRLKERVTQLDLENTALVHASPKDELSLDEDIQNPDNLDVQTLADKILKLKKLLVVANQKSEKPVNIDEILCLVSFEGEEESPLCKKYKEELAQVKEEYERYKLRAQSVLKNKSSKDNTSSKEVETLKENITELRDRLKQLHLQMEDDGERHKQREATLHKTIITLQKKHKQEISQLQAEQHHHLGELEEEIKKQRDRTVSMLSEKDRTISKLRESSPPILGSEYLAMVRLRQGADTGGAAEHQDVARHNSEEEAVSKLLSLSASGQGETTLLFFVEEQARKDVEINSLRKQKRQLETALRDLQFSASMKEELLYDETEKLKEEIRKLDRDKNREGANLEYLKNVLYKFLICTDAIGKQQMLSAITTILQFSPQEKTMVQSRTKGWWK